ncbi:hypothetical protein [Streptomyces phytophilus]|uniref:hypothetical protein n=1 Tax=Streptomyces phytophilus TaxID=722715 RepID=UPI0015F0FB62|nr:hypothetical protein [Streptomyces phytophilus]
MILGFMVCPLIAAMAALGLIACYPGEARQWLLPAARIVAAGTITIVALAALIELAR